MQPQHRNATLLLGLVLALFAVVMVRSAWVSDDAFITLRAAENWLMGDGLRYNAAERVQAYTHPLWMLVLTGSQALFRSAYEAALAASLVVSGLAVGLAALRAVPDRVGGIVLVGVLASSKGFVDFSTSGLENPLTHLLIAVFAIGLVARWPLAWLSLVAGLGLVNRLDTILIFAPGLLLAWSWTPRFPQAFLFGVVPVVAWHSVALIYYGFPLPNTAYAKLGTGIPRAELVAQGGHWVEWCLRYDLAGILAVLAAVVLGLAHLHPRWRRRSSGAVGALLLGSALYLAYVVWIGGDFMGSRFLTAPLLACAIALAHSGRPRGVPVWAIPRPLVATLVIGVSLLSPWSPFHSGPDYEKAPPYEGIVDERGYYWDGAGWLATRSRDPMPSHRFANEGRRDRGEKKLVVKATIGFYGYFVGSEVHVVDPLGLADPLLARLPAKADPDWRVGHFRRVVPRGYRELLASGQGTLEDDELQAYYDQIRLVTRGPLFTRERWAAIWSLNRHGAEHWVDTDRYRHPKRHRGH